MLSPQPLPSPNWSTIRNVRKQYKRKMYGHYPRLLQPRLFSEKMQWRKLFDLNPLYSVFCDRIAVRDYIAGKIGAEYLPELLWSGRRTAEIPFDELTPPYVLKCSHGWSMNYFVTDRERIDRDGIRQKLDADLKINHGLRASEAGYVPVPPRLIAERMMVQPDGGTPREYKIFTFGGRPKIVQMILVNTQNEDDRSIAFYDLDWHPLRWESNLDQAGETPRPKTLPKMLELSERLSEGLDHLRVDCYDWNGKIVVGELSLYTSSGLEQFVPAEADRILGDYWPLPDPALRAAKAFFGARD